MVNLHINDSFLPPLLMIPLLHAESIMHGQVGTRTLCKYIYEKERNTHTCGIVCSLCLSG